MTMLKTYPLQHDTIGDFSQNPLPVILRVWREGVLSLPAAGTHFGYVYQGCCQLLRQDRMVETYALQPGMYFCLPGQGMIEGKTSSGIVLTRLDYGGMFSLGGPIEKQGRLAYIDGGSSSLLVPPILLGDPCLNALYFPPQVDQTLHSHPSDRIGIVVWGEALLETPQNAVQVKPGTIFRIPANHLHKFQTRETSFTLVVFHPDSDAGFTHRHHPMLQRTMVEGVSAAELPEIQTRRSESL